MNNLLTNTRLATFRACPAKHNFRYELGLAPARSATPLRFGGAYHKGLEARARGTAEAEAIDVATADYLSIPDWADPAEWAVEQHTVRTLLAGHFWRYGADGLTFKAIELPFSIPLVNPETGKASRLFVLAGKIDAIVELPDGRLAVLEYKTAGEDIGPEAPYWLRLRCDPQISVYMIAARALGYPVATVLYDATRKPTIAPKQVPTLDDEGRKIVVDASGARVYKKNGEPRESASSADGFTLLSRTETAEEFSARLLADIGERPDFYYGRREVPRLDDELAEFHRELWQQSKALREAQLTGRWYRNVGKMTCDYCAYSALCLNSVKVTPGESAPAGFEYLADIHPELKIGE